ncbi:MAG: glucuronate isomerase [Armatimonadetes bacterium]|nr:glucuronate isomerase [Armatimonadota bacterium]
MAEVPHARLEAIRDSVSRAVANAKITDIHTHIYPPEFGELLLWGIDELLTYHYLIAETMRYVDIPPERFWTLTKRAQADLIWKTLFLERSPISESCRGVLTTLDRLGLDVSARDLDSYRRFFAEQSIEDYVDRVFELAGVDSVIMTNDPFDDLECPVWFANTSFDSRFRAALRMDGLLNSWQTAVPKLREWGYMVNNDINAETVEEVRRFLRDWIERMNAVYLAVSLPPSFVFPENSPRGKLISECVLPVAVETQKPFAMMIGVKKLTNPSLRLAGDSVGKASIEVVEYLCSNYQDAKFLVTMLSRENQHELCVAARKFRNLHVFGCWWFLNNPSIIDEITRMRFELLGLSVTPQHSDARVLDQLIYKWAHSREIIANVLADKYVDLAATGWRVTEDEIRRDVASLFGGNFWNFVR